MNHFFWKIIHKSSPKFSNWSFQYHLFNKVAVNRSFGRWVYSWDSHIRVVRAGFLPVPLGLPAAVAVNQLCQIGRLLGVSCDELVLQKLFGCWPLCRHCRKTDAEERLTFGDGIIGHTAVKLSQAKRSFRNHTRFNRNMIWIEFEYSSTAQMLIPIKDKVCESNQKYIW